jgi:MYXO-CTERM domain-containing protein
VLSSQGNYCTMQCQSPADCYGNPCKSFGTYVLCDRPIGGLDGGTPPTPDTGPAPDTGPPKLDKGTTPADSAPPKPDAPAPPKDTLLPQVTINSPTAMAKVAKQLTVAATITDNVGVVWAKLLVDTKIVSTMSKPPWNFPLTLAVGTHDLAVQAGDAAGNVGVASVRVIVEPEGPGPDTQAPQVTINTPAALSKVPTKLTVEATILDNVGVTSAEVFVDGAAAATKSQAPWAFPVELTPGQRTIKVVAKDAAGNAGEASVTITVQKPGEKAPYGSPCNGPADCVSGLCAGWGGQQAFCTQLCDTTQPCPAGSGCQQSSSGQGVCAPDPTAPPNGDGRVIESACAIDGRPSSRGAWPALLLLALALLLRRRR